MLGLRMPASQGREGLKQGDRILTDSNETYTHPAMQWTMQWTMPTIFFRAPKGMMLLTRYL